MRGSRIWVLVGAASLILSGCDGQPQADSSAAPQTTQVPVEDADAEVTQLPRITAEGVRELIREAADDRQVVVVDLWATWCVPCVEMFPELHAGVKALGDGVRMVSVSIDEPEAEPQAIEFLESQHAMEDAYLALPEMDARLELPKQLGHRWNNLVVPAILVFDGEGQLAGEFLDGVADVPAIIELVADLRMSETPQASAE